MLDKLRYFAAVATKLNFTKAAEECHISQTVMSRYIAALEEEVGFKLFYRNNRSVNLTPAGELFYKGACQILNDYDTLLIATKDVCYGSNGKLRIGIGQLERTLVTDLLKEFYSTFSEFEITVNQYNYSDLISNLLNETIDIAFAIPLSAMKIDEKNIKIKRIFQTENCFIMNKNHRLVNMSSIPIEEINKECLISISEKNGPYSGESFTKLCQSSGIIPKKVIKVNSLETKLLMVEAGIGISVIPKFLEQQLSPNIVMRKPDYLTDSNFAALILSANKKVGVKLFLDKL